MTTALVVYAAFRSPLRTSLADHLYALERHGDVDVIYVNAAVPGASIVLRAIDADLIVFHTLVVDARFARAAMRRIERRLEPLRAKPGAKIILPQDEYFDSEYLCRFIERFGIGHVLSVAPESEWPKIYGSIRPMPRITKVLTGYLEDSTVNRIEELAKMATRKRDIGYRAWHAEAWLGRQGQLKVQVGRRVAERASAHGLTFDIKTGAWGESLLGDQWLQYLLESRYTVGAEGGASILDRTGALMDTTRAFVRRNPKADFEEIEAACFPRQDGLLDLRALSPRHLEAAATRTGQALIEGDYDGVLRAGDHYLAIRRDFSNLDAILEQMRDESLRVQMTDRAYTDIVASGRYAYPAFARLIVNEGLRGANGLTTSTFSRRERILGSAFSWMAWRWVGARTAIRRYLVLPVRRLRSSVGPRLDRLTRPA